MQQLKKLDLSELELSCQEFVENCNLLREKQDEIEDTLNEINRNDLDYRTGKVAKIAFDFNHQRFSHEIDREKRDISQNINAGMKMLDVIEKMIAAQGIVEAAAPTEHAHPRHKHAKKKKHKHAMHHAHPVHHAKKKVHHHVHPKVHHHKIAHHKHKTVHHHAKVHHAHHKKIHHHTTHHHKKVHHKRK